MRFWDVPSRGNLTLVQEWRGNDNHGRRTAMQYGYDNWGNVVWEQNASGHRTNHVYDDKKLFLTQSTNPLGHVVKATWNKGCGAPLTETNVNNLNTTYQYDVFCRETQRILPHGQKLWTSYHSIGNPQAQNIRHRNAPGTFQLRVKPRE